MHPFETYLQKLADIKGSGHATDETSYYPALEGLLSEVGQQLKPKVYPVLQLKNRGAGQPDGGLFTKDQLIRGELPSDFAVQPPNRGAVEVKGPGAKLDTILLSPQIAKYLNAYGEVLVTNLREFRIVVRTGSNTPHTSEKYTLAEDEDTFWQMVSHPTPAMEQHGLLVIEFLTRALLSSAPISTPQVLASFLASYAREALVKVEPRSKLREFEEMRKALGEALGLQFVNEKGEHFFRSTLIQTLFYGLFSAWVLWSRDKDRKAGDRFDWKTAVWSLQVPMIRSLYEQLVIPSKVKILGLGDVLDLTGEVLNRVDEREFFRDFDVTTAVQYFYEPFLEAFDPIVRKQYGVWYTPREIVRYMVERVDRALRSELGLLSGLADPNVYILDPACGTGAYLVEVVDRIRRTLEEEGGADLDIPERLKKAVQERVFGFELLPAPFVIAHLQLGMLLQKLGAPFEERPSGDHERASVFLTNSLTGWEPPDKAKARLPYEEFEDERERADHIKRITPILVVIGNPPYDGFAGVSPSEEEGLVLPYKEGLQQEWGIWKFNMDDLYIRFFRIAERRIVKSSRGVVCFISNISWVRDPSFVVLRKNLLRSFDEIWIDNLHGNRKISEYAPDGKTSETIFAVPGFSPGIKQGVATTLWVRKADHDDDAFARVRLRDDLEDAKASTRRTRLLASIDEPNLDDKYVFADPKRENRYSFWPENVAAHYREWPKVTDLCSESPSNGLMEKRGGALIDVDRDALQARMLTYLDKSLSWEAYIARSTVLVGKRARFDARKARSNGMDEGFNPAKIGEIYGQTL